MVGVHEATSRLLATATSAGPDELPAIVMRLAPALEATAVVIYLADYGQASLVPLAGAGVPPREPMPIDTTLAGRAFTSSHPQQPTEPADRIWVPLIDGCERVGVLEVVTATGAAPQTRQAASEVAAVVTQLLITRRAYGDLMERARRRLPMQLAAEIVWGLLPPLTFMTRDAVVTAILEPCYDIGGDVFDYALNDDVLSVALFDTCGHGIQASLLAALGVNAYRNARRCGLGLTDTARSVDKWIHSEKPTSFSTAALAELDCATGRLEVITAGHPAPLLLRDGKVIKELEAPTALPLGLGHLTARRPRAVVEHLHPGDRLLLFTDGVIEARAESGEMFGTDRLVDFVTRALNDRLPTPETMRRLVQAIVDHQHEQLQDDATAVFLEWRPPDGRAAAVRPELSR